MKKGITYLTLMDMHNVPLTMPEGLVLRHPGCSNVDGG